MRVGHTGGGMAGGFGFVGGYGDIQRSNYATPAGLGLKPWAQDFLLNGGRRAFPTEWCVNPYSFDPPLQWRTEDWDPGLRFWSLPMFDPQLTEWLQDADLASPASMVAREFAQQHDEWQHHDKDLVVQMSRLVKDHWLTPADVAWTGWTAAGQAAGDPPDKAAAWAAIGSELDELELDMLDSRARYLQEALAQSDGVGPYFMHVMGADAAYKPWTMQLFQCAVAISNVAYMYFKSRFNRVRPSRLCPGLLPPFGPPQHPAFPSGHSTLGHLAALLFLQVPGIAAFHGVGIHAGCPGGRPTWDNYRQDRDLDGSLLWLAARLAKNRERIGVHYKSDSSAGRHLAGGIWNAIFNEESIKLPTLKRVIACASAEWPDERIKSGQSSTPAGRVERT